MPRWRTLLIGWVVSVVVGVVGFGLAVQQDMLGRLHQQQLAAAQAGAGVPVTANPNGPGPAAERLIEGYCVVGSIGMIPALCLPPLALVKLFLRRRGDTGARGFEVRQ